MIQGRQVHAYRVDEIVSVLAGSKDSEAELHFLGAGDQASIVVSMPAALLETLQEEIAAAPPILIANF